MSPNLRNERIHSKQPEKVGAQCSRRWIDIQEEEALGKASTCWPWRRLSTNLCVLRAGEAVNPPAPSSPWAPRKRPLCWCPSGSCYLPQVLSGLAKELPHLMQFASLLSSKLKSFQLGPDHEWIFLELMQSLKHKKILLKNSTPPV